MLWDCYSALGELEKPKASPKKIKVKESTTDLKLAELEASLREIENSKKVKFKETNNISVLHKKGKRLFWYDSIELIFPKAKKMSKWWI